MFKTVINFILPVCVGFFGLLILFLCMPGYIQLLSVELCVQISRAVPDVLADVQRPKINRKPDSLVPF